jgi:hypothetical protein
MTQELVQLSQDYVLQFTQRSEHAFDMTFSYKEKIHDKLRISTDDVADVSIGAGSASSVFVEFIDLKQCALVHLRVGSKASEVVLVFQTSFDCNLFVKSVQAIMDRSMFDHNLTPLPAQSRMLIDKCIAQKSESIGWGDRELFLMPNKLLIYSSGKSSAVPSARFPRNVKILLSM